MLAGQQLGAESVVGAEGGRAGGVGAIHVRSVDVARHFIDRCTRRTGGTEDEIGAGERHRPGPQRIVLTENRDRRDSIDRRSCVDRAQIRVVGQELAPRPNEVAQIASTRPARRLSGDGIADVASVGALRRARHAAVGAEKQGAVPEAYEWPVGHSALRYDQIVSSSVVGAVFSSRVRSDKRQQ